MATWTAVEGTLTDGLVMRVLLAEHAGSLVGVSLHDDIHPRYEDDFLWSIDGRLPWQRDQQSSGLLGLASEQVQSYFAGTRRNLDLPVQMKGTPFQLRVWERLIHVPFGTTISYGELAELIGHPAAVRAVGNANGKNNLGLIVPCHRVLAAGGKLGGYNSGLGLKRRLLAHEAAILCGRHAALNSAPAPKVP